MVLKEVELLEHHTKLCAVGVDILIVSKNVLTAVKNLPCEGVSKRLMHRRKVDLPDPEDPMMEMTSPSFTETLMSFRISRSPKDFFSPLISSIVSFASMLLSSFRL